MCVTQLFWALIISENTINFIININFKLILKLSFVNFQLSIGGKMGTNLILDKSTQFAIKIVKTYQYLKNDRKEYVMSKQLLKSGTSIGANMKEAIQAQSKKDFLSKTNIALKEASETEYWIDILMKTNYFNEKQNSLMDDCIEINKILQAIVKTTKNNLNMG